MECYAAKHEGPKECTVFKCTNNENQGNGLYLHVVDKDIGILGVEWVCMPCWDTIKGLNRSPQHSQVWRNIMNIAYKSHPDVDEYYEDDYYPVIAEEDLNG